MNILFTRFRSRFETRGFEHESSVSGFFRSLSMPVLRPKERSMMWSAARFEGGVPRLANVIDVGALVYDFDDCDAHPDQLAGGLSLARGCLHTTYSHTRLLPRIRVVLISDRRMTRPEFDRAWRHHAGLFEANGWRPDYSARDASRRWVYPSISSPDADFEFYEMNGAPICVDDALAKMPPESPLPLARTLPIRDAEGRRLERASKYLACIDGAIQGQRGSAQTWRAALHLVRRFGLCEEDAFRLLRDEYNPRCQPQWSEYDLRRIVRRVSTHARVEFTGATR